MVFIFMIASIFSISCASAQPNDLMITYDANQGVSGLVGANKVYMYSGAVTSGPSGQWEWITGSVNLDDGVGLMTPLGNGLWTICIDPAVYYGTALPILAIDIIFRNENGSAFGYDFNGTYTILDMTTPSPTSSFSGVTTGNCGVGAPEFGNNESKLSNFPNPLNNGTTINYYLPAGVKNAQINVFESTGKKVKVLILDESKIGTQKIFWEGDDEQGKNLKNHIYFYSLEVDGKMSASNKMIIAR